MSETFPVGKVVSREFVRVVNKGFAGVDRADRDYENARNSWTMKLQMIEFEKSEELVWAWEKWLQ